MVNREMIEEVKRLWGEGMSALEIAAQLGCTKNSVIGRVHRMKLAPRDALRPRQKAQEGRRWVRVKKEPEAPKKETQKPKRAPNEPPKTKSELRAMLAEAWRNTAQA